MQPIRENPESPTLAASCIRIAGDVAIELQRGAAPREPRIDSTLLRIVRTSAMRESSGQDGGIV
jgi:hypothetical protein